MTHTDLSRRKALTGIGVGLAAVAAVNGTHASPKTGTPVAGLEDPVSKYPKPPFQEQSQEWPGLAGKMNPKPDHGEKRL